MAREDVKNGTAASKRSRPTRRRWRRRTLGTLFAALSTIVILALAIDFARFADEVTDTTAPDPPAAADGIVVFTGGQDRISGAIALLSNGLAKRLLISGVHPDTTERALATLAGGRKDLFECCIDLGRSALNTIGNAEETAEWARQRGFRSLIVVTSSYHMPRSLAELGRAMPDARLEGHAITPSSLDLKHWWRKPESASVLFVEYVKLLAARARLAATDDAPATNHAGAM